MGCNPSNLSDKSSIPNMEQMYNDARLPHAGMESYKQTFEKEFF